MAAQRNGDFSQLNAQIDELISKEDTLLSARIARDWTAFHVRLDGAEKEGHQAVDEVNATARQRHEMLVALEAQFEREQAENNRLQELARRQQDITDRLKELQTALQEAKSEKEKEALCELGHEDS
jgi:DNA-binding transcriptional regulator YbjK